MAADLKALADEVKAKVTEIQDHLIWVTNNSPEACVWCNNKLLKQFMVLKYLKYLIIWQTWRRDSFIFSTRVEDLDKMLYSQSTLTDLFKYQTYV